MAKDEKKTLDEKLQRLNELAKWFEGDDFRLEEASQHYDEVKKLADELRQEIDKLEQIFTPVND